MPRRNSWGKAEKNGDALAGARSSRDGSVETINRNERPTPRVGGRRERHQGKSSGVLRQRSSNLSRLFRRFHGETRERLTGKANRAAERFEMEDIVGFTTAREVSARNAILGICAAFFRENDADGVLNGIIKTKHRGRYGNRVTKINTGLFAI